MGLHRTLHENYCLTWSAQMPTPVVFYYVTRYQFPALAKPRSPKPFAPKIL
mgnify:CR=1 FL=1